MRSLNHMSETTWRLPTTCCDRESGCCSKPPGVVNSGTCACGHATACHAAMWEGSATTQIEASAGRKPTMDEAEAILTLVRGGWLKLELTVGDDSSSRGSDGGGE